MKTGNRIAALREERGWTQEKLAERAELTQGYIALIEAGKRNPTKRVLRDIARALRTTVEELEG